MRALPPEVDRLAARQFGLATHAQLVAVLGKTSIWRYQQGGLLLRMWPGVYRLAGAPRSWRQRSLAAVLYAGADRSGRGTVLCDPPAALSHLSAAFMLRCDTVARPVVTVTVPPQRSPGSTDVVTFRRRVLPPVDVIDRWGIPTTTPARTLIDLSGLVGPALLVRVHDDLARRRLLGPEDLDERLDAADPLPRHDLVALEALRHRHRLLGSGDSPREDWIVETLVASGLPAPSRNVRIDVDGRTIEVDCAYLAARVAIEYDGWSVHGDRTHFDADRERAARLQLAGRVVLQVTSAWTAEQLVDRVRHALARR